MGRQALAQKNAAAREKKAGVPSRAGGVPDEPLQDRARVDDELGTGAAECTPFEEDGALEPGRAQSCCGVSNPDRWSPRR